MSRSTVQVTGKIEIGLASAVLHAHDAVLDHDRIPPHGTMDMGCATVRVSVRLLRLPVQCSQTHCALSATCNPRQACRMEGNAQSARL